METSLHLSAEHGDKNGVVKAIENGANVNESDTSNRSPLHYAAIGGYTEIVALLLGGGANVAVTTNRGATPLHYAARGGKIECVSLLIDNGADVDVQDKSGSTPLHEAISKQEIKAALALITKHNANVNILNKENQSPLHLAAQMGSIEVLKSLIEHDAKYNQKDVRSQTAFSIIPINIYKPNLPIEVEEGRDLGEAISKLMYKSQDKKDNQQNGTDVTMGENGHSNQDLDNAMFSDVTLVVEEHNIPAHKAIFAIRSPYFKDLFRKSTSDQIPIPNVSYNAFLSILEWVYQDNVSLFSKDEAFDLSHATLLLGLADKFKMKPLIILCESYIVRNLSTTSFASVWQALTPAIKSSCPELYKYISYLFMHNWNVLSITKSMSEAIPKNDILELLSNIEIYIPDPNKPDTQQIEAPQQPQQTKAKAASRSSISNATTPATTPKKTSTPSSKKGKGSHAVEPPSPPSGDQMDKKNLTICKNIYNLIHKRKGAEVFHYPVDPIALGIPTYPDIIKHPMDLSTIHKKLDDGSYKTIKDFAADMRLMFYNALTFNLDGTPIWILSQTLLKTFDQKFVDNFKWEKIPEWKPPVIVEAAPIAPVTPSNDKKRKSGTNIETTTSTSTTTTPMKSIVKYTDDEKANLVQKISSLNEEEQTKAINEIIDEKAIKTSEDGVEIDPNEISDACMHELEEFINSCLKKVKYDK